MRKCFFIFIILAAVILALCPAAQARLDDGLVGYWTFDEGSGTTAGDSSGNGNNGTLMNGTGWSTDSAVGSGSVNFDGASNTLVVNPSSSLNDLHPLSISVWVNQSALNTYQPFISKSDNGSGGHGWYFGSDGSVTSRLSFSVFGFTSKDLSETSVSNTLSVGSWNHYVVTWDGSNSAANVHMYKNGVEVSYASQGDGGSATPQSDAGRNIVMGRESGFGSNYFNGKEDDVRIYNRILSSQEISALYSLGNTNGSSGTANVSTSSTPPVTSSDITVPSNLEVTESGSANSNTGQIEFYLKWTDNSNDEDGFSIEQSIDNGDFTSIGTVLAQGPMQFIYRALPTSDYRYRVRAYKGTVFSDPSNTLEFTGLQQPIYFTVDTVNTNNATVLFYDRTGGVTSIGYQVERSDDNGATYSIITKKNNADLNYVTNTHGSCLNCYKIVVDNNNGTGLIPGHTYYYRVAAFNSVGLSPYAVSYYPYSTGPSLPPGYIAITPGGAPNAPGFIASLTSTPSVRLVLTDNSNNEKSFDIERSTDDVNWKVICTIGANWGEKACNDTSTILAGKTYYYRADAYNDLAKSPYTNASPVTVPGTAPPGVTQWYVWKGASGGDTGDSWQNAWEDIDQINWNAIKPGDTIYISGGSYDKTLQIYGAGAQGNPVTIRPGSASPNPSGHDSRVILAGIHYNSPSQWVTIDGSINPNYIPSSALDVDGNINMEIANSPSDAIYSAYSQGLVFRFLKITNANGVGIFLNGPTDYLDIYGVHIDHVASVGIVQIYASTRPQYDAINIRKSLIEYTGDDCIQTAGTVTISDNIMRYNFAVGSGHPDGIQAVEAFYVDIHGNEIYDRTKSSYVIVNHTGKSAVPDMAMAHWRIYNNLFYYTDKALAPGTEGIFFDGANCNEPNNAFIPEQKWDDILIANNTFYNLWNSSAVNLGVRPDEVGRVDISNFLVKNNVIYDMNIPGQIALKLKGEPASAIYYDTATLAVDNNIVTGADTKVEYNGVTYDTPEAFDVATGFSGDSSKVPQFLNLLNFDFHLSPLDTAARGLGANLSSYFTTDKDGNPRPATGAWDIGAYESQGGTVDINRGLVAEWNFNNDDFSTKRADPYRTIPFADVTGTGNTADCQSAFALNGTTYNQCPTQTIGPDGSKAAQFSSPQLCDNGGDYLAIPRNPSINQLSQGTIALWISSQGNGSSNGSNDLLYRVLDTIDTSKNLPHTWEFHRDGDIYYRFTALTDSGMEKDLITFPGGNAPAGSWNHYALTWDGAVIRGYFNGVYFGQASMTGIASFDLSNYLAIGALMHGEPRDTSDCGNCVKEYGAPAGNYVYPNAGFFSGKLDDIRIYNRPLGSDEIMSLASVATNPSTQQLLLVSKAGTGSGKIVGGGISCGSHCAEAVNLASQATLTATADPDSVFSGWGGACSGTGACSVSMNSQKSVTASFTSTCQNVASFTAANAVITAPFTLSNGSIYQNVQTAATNGGKAQFTFNVSAEGNYLVSAMVNAPSQSSNSFYVNIDSNPVDETTAWHITPTVGFEKRFVSWGGSTEGGNPAHIFNLSAGEHTLIIRGREAGTYLQSLTIEKVGNKSSQTAYGDVSGDGTISVYDAALAAQAAVGLITLTDTQKKAADVSGDGVLTTYDAALIAQRAAGLISKFPVE